MRLAHLADLHLGYRQYYRQNALGINQREADVAGAFRSAVTGVIAARPDVVVVAGDLFHSVRPTNQAIVFCFQQFQQLRTALPNAPIVVVAGNHDTPRAVETGSILRLFTELGIQVVSDEAEWLEFGELDLRVLAMPHAALMSPGRVGLKAEGKAKYEVLVVHGEVENLFPLDRWWAEPGGALIDPGELAGGGWSYVALGHYHVQKQVGPRCWYSGALDYVTPNPWGELYEERKSRVKGKGWLLVDLETGKAESKLIERPREIVDVKPVEGAGLSAAELDHEIQSRLGAVRGGITDKLVRLVVKDVPRHVLRELDHAAIRAAKASALHLHLDFRRPDARPSIGVGAPGPRQTLTDVLRAYLANRPLPERIERDRFVREGVELLESIGVEPEGAV